jgi:hypothetical protein
MALTLIAQSDLLSIKADHGNRMIKIRYTNEQDLDGISYSLVTKQYFELLIEAKFSKPRDKEESEGLDLSDGSTESLMATLKKQIQLSTGLLPFHLHQTIRRALIHNYCEVGGVAIKKEESYEQKEPEERSELVSAQVWLTPKDENYLVNVYGTV